MNQFSFMKKSFLALTILVVFIGLFSFGFPYGAKAATGSIVGAPAITCTGTNCAKFDDGSRCNFACANCGVSINDEGFVVGSYMWCENIGYVNLRPSAVTGSQKDSSGNFQQNNRKTS